MKASPLFSIRSLRFAYQQNEVLKVDSLDFGANQVIVLAGGNGSGKTTFLKLLNGLLQPTSGDIFYCGESLKRGGCSRIRSESVLVHQNPYLFSGSVYQNVAYGLKIRKTAAEIIRKKVTEKLALIGLGGLAHRKAHELSGGEKQRLGIARAIVLEPRILLLDEPTANVDPDSTRLIESLVLKFARSSTTVIMSSHNLGFAYRLCTQLIHLEEGRVVPNRVNIFKGRVVKQDDRFTYFKTGRRQLHCPAQAGEFTTAVLPMDDVILSENPIHTSAQNSFLGRVKGIERVDHLYRVGLDCGFRVQAHITEYSLERLNVKFEKEFHVTFKAAAIKLY
ncbi:Vitamin B12 import ATP-binding protein BtuD [subsurface metagenome]